MVKYDILAFLRKLKLFKLYEIKKKFKINLFVYKASYFSLNIVVQFCIVCI